MRFIIVVSFPARSRCVEPRLVLPAEKREMDSPSVHQNIEVRLVAAAETRPSLHLPVREGLGCGVGQSSRVHSSVLPFVVVITPCCSSDSSTLRPKRG